MSECSDCIVIDDRWWNVEFFLESPRVGSDKCKIEEYCTLNSQLAVVTDTFLRNNRK